MLSILIALVIVGAVLYIISLIPIDSRIKQIIYVLVVVVLAIWALKILVPMSGI